jgi:hypothetical protein
MNLNQEDVNNLNRSIMGSETKVVIKNISAKNEPIVGQIHCIILPYI